MQCGVMVQDEDKFFEDYAVSHMKLSELGYVLFLPESYGFPFNNPYPSVSMHILYFECFMYMLCDFKYYSILCTLCSFGMEYHKAWYVVAVWCCSLPLWCFLVAALRSAHTKLEYIENTISKLNVKQCVESSNLKHRYLY